ncbi:MAG: Fic family protein [Burkholderiales bacterium]
MEVKQFTDAKAGRVVPIATRAGADYAFVPNPLPGSWRMHPDRWPLVAKAQHHVGRLEQIKGILPNPSLLLRPLQRREAIHSSILEGTYTTPEQLLLYEQALSDGAAKPETDSRKSDEPANEEVYNCNEALREGHNWISAGKPLNEELILLLHRILMTGARGKDKRPGEFRTKQNFVGGRKFIPPPIGELQGCIHDFIAYLGSNDDTFDPLVRAYVVHYQFEAIHPFEDGNGRVGRLLLSLCVSKWCDLTMPWLYMSEYFERNRHEYVTGLFRISTHGEWDEWIDFCLRGTIEQATDAIDRCKKLQDLRDGYHEKLSGLGPRMHEIVELLFKHPVIRTGDVRDACDVSYETARVDTGKLVEAGIIQKIEGRYPQAFAAREILDVAYGS